MAGESEGPYRTGGRRRDPEGPERSASSQATPARILTKLLVFAVPNLVYAGVCVAGLASWSGAAAVFFVTSLLVAPVRADVRDAKATLVTLPFPVHHDPPSVLEFPELSCVREVRIQLVDRLDGISADHRAVEAEAQVEGLRVTMLITDGVILLTGWQTRHNDLPTLSILLDTWGRRVHDCARIAEVQVTWSSSPNVV